MAQMNIKDKRGKMAFGLTVAWKEHLYGTLFIQYLAYGFVIFVGVFVCLFLFKSEGIYIVW